MKWVKIVFFLVLIAAVGFGVVSAADEVTLERGKALFNDPNLGTNGKSCSTCHADGKGLSKAGEKSDLPQILNGCITQGLKGNALDVNSADMQSLVLYVKSFGKKKPARRPAIGC